MIILFIISARDAVNNFLDDEKNHNKYLSPTEMNCLGIILLPQYINWIVMLVFK